MPMKRKFSKSRGRKLSKTAVRQVRSIVSSNQETKQNTVSYSDAPVQDAARSPINVLVQNIGQGDTQITRNGNEIRLTGVYMNGYFTYADSTNVVRVLIYIPKDVTDDMATDTISVNTAVDLDKYTILLDRRIFLDNSNRRQVPFKWGKSFKTARSTGLRTTWHNTSGGGVVKNGIKYYMVSDSMAIADPTFSGEVRSYFKDA